MSEVANLAIKISADVKEATKGLRDVQSKMGEMSQKVGTAGKNMTKWVTGPMVAVGAGMFGLASKTGAYADRILDLNAITGLSTDSIQEWAYVADIAGVSNEAVTNAVTGLVRRLPQLEAEGGKATEGMKKLGLSYDELSKLSPDEQVDTLIYALAEMEDPLERNAIGSQLFGGAWQDIAPILGMGADEIAKTRDQAHELGAVMGNDALNEANNFRIEMQKLKTEFMGAARGIASDLIPILREVFLPIIRDHIIPVVETFIGKIGELMEWFKGLSREQQQNVLMWVGIVAAIGPALLVVSKLIAGIKLLIGVFVFLTSPIGLAIAAFAALIAIGVLVWKNWDTIKQKAAELHERVRTAVQNMVQAVIQFFRNMWERAVSTMQSMVQSVVTFFQNLHTRVQSTVQNMVNAVVNFFRNLHQRVQSTVQNMVSAVVNFFVNLGTRIQSTVQNMVSAVVNFFTQLGSRVRSVISAMVSAVVNLFSNLFSRVSGITNNIRSTISNIFNSLAGIVRGAMSRVVSAVTNGMMNALKGVTGMFGSFKDAGRNIIGNIADGIKGAVSMVTDAVGGVMKKARDLLPFSPPKDKSSPLADIHKNGIGTQIAAGIENGEREVNRAMHNLLDGGANMTMKANVQASQQGSRPVVINIGNIENNSDSDIPHILEQAAWILGREGGGLSGA